MVDILTIYLIAENESIPQELKPLLIRDIERGFQPLKLTGDPIELELLHNIEQADYIDHISIRDRFGYNLHISNLSTGTKAALCVINYPDKVIDTIECGLNARDEIIKLCRTGSILVRDNGVTIGYTDDKEIDVGLNGHHFSRVSDLNDYISNIYPLW